MYNNKAVYNLFMRNWLRGTANEEHIDKAVEKELITAEQGEEIKNTPRNEGI